MNTLQKVRILGIAPYEGLKKAMLLLAGQRNDIEMDAYTADLNAGVETALEHADYDVIISRGATAKRIADASPIPVIEVPVSVYDVLRVIKLTQHYSGDYAIVGFSEITKTAHLLCDLLQYDIPILTVKDEKEIPGILNTLKEKNYTIILCDTSTENVAKNSGLTPILITSGSESIQAAFDSAVQLCHGYIVLHDNNQILKEALRCQAGSTYLFKKNGDLFFTSAQADSKHHGIISYLTALLKDLKSNTFKKSFHSIDDTLYAVSLHTAHTRTDTYYIFTVEANPVPQGGSSHGVRFSDSAEMRNQYYGSFYSLTSGASAMEERINLLNQNTQPVMILGEKGTGKDQVAARLYIDSPYASAPFIQVNCELLNLKHWDYFIHNYHSPICDNDNTIFISNLHALSSLQRKQLLLLALDTNLAKRNRLILSCSKTRTDKEEDPARDFIDYLPCTTLNLPPLRELNNDLASSSSLYLNVLNVELSKEVIGLTPDAMALLKAYHWPQNYMQLKRVLTELVILSDSSYITSELAAQLIEKEKLQFPESKVSHSPSFDYNRTLDEMTREIIQTVLSEYNGNQTRAAKQLGIGRTTLWRYLK